MTPYLGAATCGASKEGQRIDGHNAYPAVCMSVPT